MKHNHSPLLLIILLFAGIACFPSGASAAPVHLLDFTGITITDNLGVPTTEFGPGNVVNIEAAFTLSPAGHCMAARHCYWHELVGRTSAEIPLWPKGGLQGSVGYNHSNNSNRPDAG